MVLRKSRLSGQEVFDFQPIDFDHVAIFQFDRARAYILTVNTGRRSTRGLVEADDKVAIGALVDLY
jgi:hypothetical protein